MRRFASGVFVSLLCATAASGAGPTFVVNDKGSIVDANPGDGKCETAPGNGICTLTAAIQEANTAMDAIVLLPASTVVDPIDGPGYDIGHRINAPMTIQGTGMKTTVVSGRNVRTVFGLENVAGGTVTLRDLSIVDGLQASDSGGAIWHHTCAPLLLERVRVANSSSAVLGGGIYVLGGPLTMIDSVVENCHATNASLSAGGAIEYDGGGCGIGVIAGSTIDGNSSAYRGGGISIGSGELHVVNTTVSGNVASSSGGGLLVLGGQLHLENATVAGNGSNTFAGGGGLYNSSAAVAANFANTILANNREAGGQGLVEGNCAGLLTSLGHNLYGIDDTTHCSIQGGGVTVADPGLGPLQNNGGATPTLAIGAASPAIDAGDPMGCTSQSVTLTTDQRGVHRPLGSACDIGAYERTPCGDVNGDGSVNVGDVFFLINYLFAGGPLPPGLANVNADSSTDVSDVFYLINALFAGGPAPSCPGT